MKVNLRFGDHFVVPFGCSQPSLTGLSRPFGLLYISYPRQSPFFPLFLTQPSSAQPPGPPTSADNQVFTLVLIITP